MSKSKTNSYSGAVLRMQRDERLAAQADPAEQTRRTLENHERVIENARRSFVALGKALLAIRSDRLYAAEYSTFAEYCEVRWDVSETYANRMINAALVAIEATPIGVEINSEAVARELVGLTGEALRRVWDEATRRAAGSRVTAALVKEVRRSLEPPKLPPLEGEIVDSVPDRGDSRSLPRENSRQSDLEEPPGDPLDAVPAARDAVNAFLNDQTSGLADAAPVDESGEDRPASVSPGEAGDGGPSPVVDVSIPSANPTDSGSSPEEPLPVDEPEEAALGVTLPPPAPRIVETDEEKAEREAREFRTDRTLEFCRALVDLTMRLGKDPVAWFEKVYLPGVYEQRDLPQVKDCFEPESLHRLAVMLDALGEHLTRTGKTL